MAEAQTEQTRIGCAQKQECHHSGRGSWEGLFSPQFPYCFTLFFNLTPSKHVQPNGAYLCDFRKHAWLVRESQRPLEDMLSQREMEVTSDSTHGDVQEPQAGKEGSLRMPWLLNLWSIGCRRET